MKKSRKYFLMFFVRLLLICQPILFVKADSGFDTDYGSKSSDW